MRQYLNDDWKFAFEYSDNFEGEDVRIPHTVAVTPFNYFDASVYETVSGYKRKLDIPKEWEGKRIFLNFDAVAHKAEVFVNGQSMVTHSCGYTAFGCEITKVVNYGGANEVVVKCDSRESLNIPPFGFVIDYMTYGGIYREVHLDVYGQTFISDIFVSGSSRGKAKINVTADGNSDGLYAEYELIQNGVSVLTDTGSLEAEIQVPDVKVWDIDSPNLYTLKVKLIRDGEVLDESEVEFGFRDIEWKADGFYLNGRKVKLMGLNRHQCFPYVGYAMPKNMQIRDAEILKYELGVNVVRTSHYPQSHHFISACDRLGLLVITEIPGWQNIGDSAWKAQAVENTREMVEQYRNHPSIIVWGVRINESVDDDEFYKQTNKMAHSLDDTRPTTGIRYLEKSNLLEDVYAYNDFSHNGGAHHCNPKKKVTSDMSKAYFISECNGHMYPTKTYDSEVHRTEHAIRHANVMDGMFGEEDIAGALGWCMFDYNTHKDFGSGDHICYHGVLDMFRNHKLAAAVYTSQFSKRPFLQISSSMDIGEHPAGNRGSIYIFTNCDSVKMYKNGEFIKEYTHKDSPYKNLPDPPILIDDYIGDRMREAEGFTDRQNKIVKDAMNYNACYGLGNAPLKIKLNLLEAVVRYHMKPEDAYNLFQKYIGNWGGKSLAFRFEGIKDGKVVCECTKSTASEAYLVAQPSTETLREEDTYDVCAVRVCAVDEYGNILNFFNSTCDIDVEGPAEFIGPCNLEGGMGGFFLKTLRGKTGTVNVKLNIPGHPGVATSFVIEVED